MQKTYSKLARNATDVLRGLMAQCDTHGKISKHVDEEFVREI